MPLNIEIKASADDLESFRTIAESIANKPCETLYQEDVFFKADKGRLKLRIFSETSGELIHYERPDVNGVKQSDYQICTTTKPQQLRKVLARALGETVIVKKKREVYFVGQTRVHLDEVDGLGSFIELEVVLNPEQTAEEGRFIARNLMEKLGISGSNLVACAYADLIALNE